MTQQISLKTTKDSEAARHTLLKETADFMLLVGPKTMEPHKGNRGYLLFNKTTQLVEAEGLSEAYARLGLKYSQDLLEQVKSGNYPEPGGLDFDGFDNGNPPTTN